MTTYCILMSLLVPKTNTTAISAISWPCQMTQSTKSVALKQGYWNLAYFWVCNPTKILGVPVCFGLDIMHLGVLNLPDLLINLWHGMLDCEKTDDCSTWAWAKLKCRTWEEHGQKVTAATHHLPGSFDWPLQSSAEKISSGYKAWEFLLYFDELGPGLFLDILLHAYYYNYCKPVLGMWIINQYQIDAKDLLKAHDALLQFACEFKVLYYQCWTDCLHFVWQSIHTVTHLAPEVLHIGPPACSSQWMMERTIGNLGQEVWQPSNFYANLSQWGLLQWWL